MITHQLDARMKRMLQDLIDHQARRVVMVEGIERAPRGGAFAPFKNMDTWGEDSWQDFRFSLRIPDGFCDMPVLRVKTGREGGWDALNPQFVVRVNGRVEQAFDVNHTVLLLRGKAGDRFDVVLNGYCAPLKGDETLPYLKLTLEDINQNLMGLYYDLSVPYQAAMLVPPGERERETTLETLNRALDMLDLRRPHSEAFDCSVKAAREYLAKEYYAPRAKLAPVAVADCVGHTHIDVAWLWDLYQTRHKAVRSFSTVLNLMQRYPEYKFMSSQAALYDMVKTDEPELYGRIREAVARGQWEVEGGMWVECDCNVTGGESLVRQFLYGQEFFVKEFGKKSRILWLPDVFGYSAALPQIMKKSGIDYFMTTKLSWSEFNLSPYDTFQWKGIDASQVLTHFSPSREYFEAGQGEGHEGLSHYTTYNAMITPSQIAGGWKRFQQKALDDEFLVSFGYGDGGGGPTDWMLENARRMSAPMPATPSVRMQHARPFFEELEKRVKDDPRLPTWSGELYLEYHRGTYTAIGKNKRNNRKMELLLREVELWGAMAQKQTGFAYPHEQMRNIWREALTLQFHDILPGSSIKKVYDDSDKMYAEMFEKLYALRDEMLSALAARCPGDIALFNSLSASRDDVVWFDAPEWVNSLVDEKGARYPVQRDGGKCCAFVRGLAPMCATPMWFDKEVTPAEAVKADEHGFDTPFFKGAFDGSMRITSLVVKENGREVCPDGQTLNRIVCYENKPHNYDAWDVNIYYDRRQWPVDAVSSVELISSGPVLSRLRVKYGYMDSTIDQDVVVYHDLNRIDFETQVDWREKQYMLKAHFPVDAVYTDAVCDIQYGNVKRPVHKNTSWDVARFEICAHKWADVGEDDFGAALMNDCKYGYSIDEGDMALTLLKSSVYPNEAGDQETHRFTYSFMPHEHSWREANVPLMAYQLNVPVTAARASGGQGKRPASFAAVEQPNVVIEAVKPALDGNGIIVRAYENFGRRALNVRVQLDETPREAVECNMLEEPLESANVTGGALVFDLKPYEIKTFRLI